jgi:hypothetical protein
MKEDIVSIDQLNNDKEKKEDKIEKKDKDIDRDNKEVSYSKKQVIKENNNIEVEKKKELSYKKNVDKIESYVGEEFEVNDFIRKNRVGYRKLDSDMNGSYLSEVSKELENGMVSQTIELTEYEQEQEDNAIISYRELLNASKRENIVNDGTVEFIEELKKFRNNLDE